MKGRGTGGTRSPGGRWGTARTAGSVLLLTLAALTGAIGPVGAAPPPPSFLMTIHESGLPSTLSWTVLINSPTEHSAHYTVNGSTYSKLEQVGVVNVAVFPVGLYQPNESTHVFSLMSGPVWWNFTFVKNNSVLYDNNSTGTGPAFGLTTVDLEFLGIVGVLAVIASYAVYRSRRGPSERADRAPAGAPKKPKRGAPKKDEEDEDPEAAARRKARRERREGIRRDRDRPGRPKPTGTSEPSDDGTQPEEP